MALPANELLLPTKLCHIVKRADFDGYGFNLHSEKAKPGQFIGKVDANSPAEASGLKEGDRIIEVNGVAISGESHKQVVQRIKTISNEVRLLLVDVDGKGDKHADNNAIQEQDQKQMVKEANDKETSDRAKMNGQQQQQQQLETQGNAKVQMMPGASDNINSISIVSTKRMIGEESKCLPSMPMQTASVNDNSNTTNTSNASPVSLSSNNSRMKSVHSHTTVTPSSPVPSANTSTHSNTNSNSNSNNSQNVANDQSAAATSARTMTSTSSDTMDGNKSNGSLRAGSLQLPMTAAEMRAKLLAKKKYDPKNESVDLKKKYEIVQKL